jgi:hypothetical protein
MVNAVATAPAVENALATVAAPAAFDLPAPEFLDYEPLEDDFPLQPTETSAPAPTADDWDLGVCTDNAVISDPFASLWDRNAVTTGQDLYNGLTTTLGKRPVLANAAAGADSLYEDEWEVVDQDSAPAKRSRGAPASSMYEDDKMGHRHMCPRATRVLKDWMTSPEHFDHPYPDDKEKLELAAKAGITTKQLTIWFTNARKRIWVPMRKRQVGRYCAGLHFQRAFMSACVCVGLADHWLR